MTTTTRRSASIRTGLAAVAAGAMIALLPTAANAAPTPAASATAAAAQVPGDILAHILDYENLVAHNPTIVIGAKVGDIQCNADLTECWQVFEHGAIFADANHAVRATEPVYKAMQAAGGADVIGYPAGDQFCPTALGGGCRQFFTKGEVDTLPNGTEAYAVDGPIEAAYLKASTRYSGFGGPQGAWGFPTSNATCDASGVCTQAFQRAYIVATPDGAVYQTSAPIYERYRALGQGAGALGVPVGGVVCDLPNNGCYEAFQNGWIITSPATGTWEVTGDVQQQFASPEDMAAKVGLPTGAAIQRGRTTVQTFEKSTVRITPGTAKRAHR